MGPLTKPSNAIDSVVRTYSDQTDTHINRPVREHTGRKDVIPAVGGLGGWSPGSDVIVVADACVSPSVNALHGIINPVPTDATQLSS